jgi:hypothetical protein
MNRAIAAAAIVFAIAGTTAVYAQHWPAPWRGARGAYAMSTDDMSAMADARIAGVKAGLRLTPDQEKLWPPVEAAARDLAKLRVDRVAARREEMRGRRERRSDDTREQAGPRSPDEMFDRFKRRADDMTTSAAALKKLSDAAEPLYKSLNDDQKRRLVMLVRPGMHRHFEERRRWRERTDQDGDRGRDGPRFHRERGERFENLPLDRQQL